MEWTLIGTLVGSSRVVLTSQEDGVLIRYVLEADPSEPGSRTRPRPLGTSPHGRREAEGLHQRHRLAWKRSVWALSTQYDAVLQSRGTISGG